MKIKTTLAVIALSLSPTLALAGGCTDKAKEITASSCIAGSTWDEAKGSCVANPTS
mgnify:CR=1 FL=1